MRLAWAIYQYPGRSGLHRETYFQNNQEHVCMEWERETDEYTATGQRKIVTQQIITIRLFHARSWRHS